MDPRWKKNITENTQHWKIEEAEKFLDFLQERIGKEKTIERLKASSLFSAVRYESFVQRVLFYERYIGREGVNNNLSKSFKGFERGSISRIEAFVHFLEQEFSNKFGELWIRGNMKDNILFASYGNKDEFIKVQNFIHQQFGETFAEELIKKQTLSFIQARRQQLEPVLAFLGNYLDSAGVRRVLIENMSVVVLIQIHKFKPVVEFLEQYIGRGGIALKMQESLSTLRFARPDQLKPVVEFVEQRIGRDLLKQKIIKSLQGFNRVRVEHLKRMEALWGMDTMKKNLENYGLRNPLFHRAVPSSENNPAGEGGSKMDRFVGNMRLLQPYFQDEELVQLAKSNMEFVFETSPEQLNTAITEIQRFFTKEEISLMLTKDFQKFLLLSELVGSFDLDQRQ